jgi:hypothetical protein
MSTKVLEVGRTNNSHSVVSSDQLGPGESRLDTSAAHLEAPDCFNDALRDAGRLEIDHPLESETHASIMTVSLESVSR